MIKNLQIYLYNTIKSEGSLMSLAGPGMKQGGLPAARKPVDFFPLYSIILNKKRLFCNFVTFKRIFL